MTYAELDRASDALARALRGRGVVRKRISFVYSGDPRFGGIESGFVVLALGASR